MQRARRLAILLPLLCCAPTLLYALGEEHFGNEPLSEVNYTNWPGIMPVVNDLNRVYHRWINGNEHFYYRGKTDALNAALRHFAASTAEVHEVIFRPGPGMVSSLDQKTHMPFDWNLHLIGGIARHVLSKEKGEYIWSKYPEMSVYVGFGGNVDLDRIVVPDGVRVIELSDLRERYLKGLESSDKTVRGWGTGELASLDPFHRGNAESVAKFLEDPDTWVRLNAAGAMAEFGKTAEFALGALRKCLSEADEQLRASAAQTIKKIESAKDDPARTKEHQSTLERIRRFRQGLKQR